MNSYVFVNGVEIYKFTGKGSERNKAPLCFDNVSKGLSVSNMKKTELYGCVNDFLVYYDSMGLDNVLDIYKYL